MVDSRLDELVQLKLDGCLSLSEEEELRLFLDRDEAARRYLDDMASIAGSLDELGELRPPIELQSQIAAEVTRDAKGHAKPTPTETGRSVWTRGRVVRLGVAIAAAVFVAILLTPVVVNQLDTDQLGGTMTNVENGADAPIAWSIPVELSHATGSIAVEQTRERVLLDLELLLADGVEAVIRFEPNTIELETVDGVSATTGAESREPGLVVLDLTSGRVRLGFVRRSREPGSLRVEILEKSGMSPDSEAAFVEVINF